MASEWQARQAPIPEHLLHLGDGEDHPVGLLEELGGQVVVRRNDEIGAIGQAFDQLINYMQDIGVAAAAIANNDLTLSVTPQSPKDELGNAFGHIALAVPDAYAACAEIKARGGVVVREAGPMKHGSTVIAFVEDPDGYKIEVLQRNGRYM